MLKFFIGDNNVLYSVLSPSLGSDDPRIQKAFICHSYFVLISQSVFVFLTMTFLKSRGHLFYRKFVWLFSIS